MEPFEQRETDFVVDLQVSVADVDVSTSAEIVGEQQAIGSIAGSSVGNSHGVEVRRGLPQGGVAGADEHSEQVMVMARSPNILSLQWGPCPMKGQYIIDNDTLDTVLGTIFQQEQDSQLHVIGYTSCA